MCLYISIYTCVCISNSSLSLSNRVHESPMMPHNRKFLQDYDSAVPTTPSPTITYSLDPLNQPIINGSSIINNRPIKPNMPFDSSMALTIVVLFTALFFMGFFSIYIRRFSDDNSAAVALSRRRRQNQGGSPGQSFPTSRFNPQKGLDLSTVRSLPLVPYGGAAKYPIDCVICLTEFEERENVKLIPYCRHVFHRTCIDTWLASHASCPLCRSSQLFKPFEEVCLGVEQSSVSDGVSDLEGRSTVVDIDTCREEGREVGTVGMRRTRIETCEEICLGVGQSSISDGVSDLEGRSTVIDVNTCREVGTLGITIRRTSSCSSLGDHTVLQRTTSV